MMNNGVHWASDYPLAIGVGYLMGKVTSAAYRRIENTSGNQTNSSNGYSILLPVIYPESGVGFSWKYVF
jgi:hypothetical protein